MSERKPFRKGDRVIIGKHLWIKIVDEYPPGVTTPGRKRTYCLDRSRRGTVRSDERRGQVTVQRDGMKYPWSGSVSFVEHEAVYDAGNHGVDIRPNERKIVPLQQSIDDYEDGDYSDAENTGQ